MLIAAPFLVGACDGPDLDSPWVSHERRDFYRTSADARELGTRTPGEYVIFTPQGVARRKLTLAAAQSLVIGRDVTVTEPPQPDAKPLLGCISSVGALTIGARSQVGIVYAMGQSAPDLGDGVVVTMYVKSSVSPRGHLAMNDSTMVVSAGNSSVEGYRWHVAGADPQPLPGDALTAVGQPARPLAPGSYESLVVPAGKKALLGPGSYFLNSLSVKRDGALEIDNASGLVHVWVGQSLEIAGNMREYSTQPSTLIGYEGSEPPQISAAFHGTLVSPNATVSLPATAQPHSGAFFARAIQVADRTVIEHRTFLGWQLQTQDPRNTCRLCAVAATATLRRCYARSLRGPTPDTRSAVTSIGNGTGSRKVLNEYVALDDCLSRVMPDFVRCEERLALVPDACEKLEAGYRPVLSRDEEGFAPR